MPLRPDLSSGLNLSRRATTPVKLPKMNFPMIGGVPESAPGHAEPAHQPLPGAVEGTVPMPEEVHQMPMMPAMPPQPVSAPAPVVSSREAARVIVYGRAGCVASMNAIQDLIERQVSFTYYDVSRDAKAMAHLQSISGGGEMVVPVVIQIGFGGT
ncbi:MAG TPA: glutaredoxin domain-containing protein [Symbiobacteriaceae bacterium]|nr:glutaredoxin domain-containing protein [Symbiobacteriaceae bacterium]